MHWHHNSVICLFCSEITGETTVNTCLFIKYRYHCARETAHLTITLPMMTSSNGNIFRVTGPLCGNSPVIGEFPSQRPVTQSFDVSFDLRPNKRLSKQLWGWWFETPSWSLWRQCNALFNESSATALITEIVRNMLPRLFHYHNYYFIISPCCKHIITLLYPT